jgi:hypothetical protein
MIFGVNKLVSSQLIGLDPDWCGTRDLYLELRLSVGCRKDHRGLVLESVRG